MRKLPVILFMAFYCLGTLLSPFGSLFNTKNITEVYGQCRTEDPDINLLDFAFEHLLNLESIPGQFENEEEEQEQPHQPYQQIQSLSQTFIVVTKPVHFEATELTFFAEEQKTYPAYRYYFIPSAFLTEVFHPPSASLI